MKKYKLVLPVVGLALGSVFLIGSTKANAFGFSNHDEMVKTLAAKLGVSETKVQESMDSIRQERQTEMKQQFETRLNQLVTEGKVTADQKQLILEKHNQIQANRGQFQNLASQERRAQMQKQHDELSAWANANGIDPNLVFGMGKGGMHRSGMGFNGRP